MKEWLSRITERRRSKRQLRKKARGYLDQKVALDELVLRKEEIIVALRSPRTNAFLLGLMEARQRRSVTDENPGKRYGSLGGVELFRYDPDTVGHTTGGSRDHSWKDHSIKTIGLPSEKDVLDFYLMEEAVNDVIIKEGLEKPEATKLRSSAFRAFGAPETRKSFLESIRERQEQARQSQLTVDAFGPDGSFR